MAFNLNGFVTAAKALGYSDEEINAVASSFAQPDATKLNTYQLPPNTPKKLPATPTPTVTPLPPLSPTPTVTPPPSPPSPETAVRQQGGNWMQKTGNFLVNNAPTVGSFVGGILGLPAGGWGSVPMSGVGGAVGKVIQNKIQNKKTTKEDLRNEAAAGVVGDVTGLLGGKVIGNVFKETGKIAAKKFAQVTDSQAAKVLTEHGKNILDMVSQYVPKGAKIDEVANILQTQLKAAEDAIQAVAGKVKDKISVDVLTQLEKQKETLLSQIGSDKKVKAINKVITEVVKKYKNGISVPDALKTLRAGNETFGKNVLNVTAGDAVQSASQKIETNAVREALKVRFPVIAEALDKQSDILTLLPIIKNASGKAGNQTAWDLFKGFDLAKPATYMGGVEAAGKLVGLPDLTSLGIRMTGGPIPSMVGGATKLGAQSLTSEALNAVPQELPSTSQTGVPTPTPMPPGGETKPVTSKKSIQEIEADYQNKLNLLKEDMNNYRKEGYAEKDVKETEDKLKAELAEIRKSELSAAQADIESAKTKTGDESAGTLIDPLPNVIKLLDADLSWNLGMKGKYLPQIAGTSRYDQNIMMTQLKEQLATQARSFIKGQGQISDRETEMLRIAASGLDVGMTEEAYKAKLQEIKNIIENNRKRVAAEEQSGLPATPSLSINQGLPSKPSKYPQKWQYS